MKNLGQRLPFLLLILIALSATSAAFAADLGRGVDLWRTAGSGMTFTSFSDEPVPADFFCRGSQPFAGTLQLQGAPLTTRPAGALGYVDTVVNRLDDVTLDHEGVGYTRIELLALSLVSAEPITTECGAYEARVSLAGRQPRTKMRIVRTNERGGTYSAPLSLRVKVRFVPVAGNSHPEVSLERSIELGPGTRSVWTYQIADRTTPIQLDTDGDHQPDRVMPNASNFLAGVEPAADVTPVHNSTWSLGSGDGSAPVCPTPLCPYQSCHCNPDQDTWDPFESRDGCNARHLHCVWVCVQLPNVDCASAGL